MVGAALSWFRFGSWEDIVRYAIVLEGCVLAGVNLALIAHAPEIFTRRTCSFWRIVLVAKTIITCGAAGALLRTSGSLTWMGPVFAAGFTLALVGIGLLWTRRPFRAARLSDVVPSQNATEIVQAQARD